MKLIINTFAAFVIFSYYVLAQSSVTIKINMKAPGRIIPSDFSGLSFETASLLYNYYGTKGYFFDSTNIRLITLFKNLGIKDLRIGGGTVDIKRIPVPGHKDIDALFRFAKAAGVKVIYSLRLQNGNPSQDASTAKYIWDKYKKYLVCFAIGNEPDYGIHIKRDPEITSYSTFLAKWRRFAKAVMDSVPNAIFGGPDSDLKFGHNFSWDEKNTNFVKSIYLHYYVGGNTKGKNPGQLIDSMLSLGWDSIKYPAFSKIAASTEFPYRFTESNCYVTGQPKDWRYHNSYSTLATAMYALDYMHWWAEAKHCEGVNFHTRQWKYNGTVYRDANGNYQIYPIGYGIAAFNIGGHGKTESVALMNPDKLNLTAYAVADSGNLFVTVINKEHGRGGRTAEVTINALGTKGKVLFLKAPDNSAAAISGITLGGEKIENNRKWKGKWRKIISLNETEFKVTVHSSSAAIVKISSK